MNFSRRTFLLASGAAGVGVVGIGYWQRRRLLRHDEISAFDDIASLEVPHIEEDPVISMTILEGAYTRAIDRFDDIEPRLDPPFDRYPDSQVEDLRDRLTDSHPDQVTVESHVPSHGPPAMHAARRQALRTYRRHRSRLVSVLSHESPDERSPEPFADRSTAVEERIESVSMPHRGTTLGEAIVAAATVDSTVTTATSRLERARTADDSVVQWTNLERAEAAVTDAESLVEARSGTDYGDDVPSVAEHLAAEYTARQADAPDPILADATDSDDIIPTFFGMAQSVLYRSMGRVGAAPSARGSLVAEDRYGRSALTHLLMLPILELYGAFEDVPGELYWDELDYEYGAAPEDLRQEKTAAVSAVEPHLTAEDPLIALLAAVPLGVVRNADQRLQRLTDDPRAFSDEEWASRRDTVKLMYESARRYADAIDETIAIVNEW